MDTLFCCSAARRPAAHVVVRYRKGDARGLPTPSHLCAGKLRVLRRRRQHLEPRRRVRIQLCVCVCTHDRCRRRAPWQGTRAWVKRQACPQSRWAAGHVTRALLQIICRAIAHIAFPYTHTHTRTPDASTAVHINRNAPCLLCMQPEAKSLGALTNGAKRPVRWAKRC